MERQRMDRLAKEKELITVNIPALKLIYRKNGKNILGV
jgi:murein L,D-transpeptidase YcbB/YkuD